MNFIFSFDGTKEVTAKEADFNSTGNRNPFRRLSKSAQDLKRRWFRKKPTTIRRGNHNNLKHDSDGETLLHFKIFLCSLYLKLAREYLP